MYAELYPAPDVNWYPDAQLPARGNPAGLSFPERPAAGRGPACDSFTNYNIEGPPGASLYIKSEYGPHGADVDRFNVSFYTKAASEGLKGIVGAGPWAPAATATAARGAGALGELTVYVDGAWDVSPSDNFGLHHYCATAYYPGDLQRDVEARKTPATKGHPSEAGQGLENCSLQRRVSLPHNPRHQLLMVDLYEVDQLGDTFMGRVTVPLADPKLASPAAWPLVSEDGCQNGSLTLHVQAPGGDPMLATQPNQALNVTACGKDSSMLVNVHQETLNATHATAYGRDSMTLPNHEMAATIPNHREMTATIPNHHDIAATIPNVPSPICTGSPGGCSPGAGPGIADGALTTPYGPVPAGGGAALAAQVRLASPRRWGPQAAPGAPCPEPVPRVTAVPSEHRHPAAHQRPPSPPRPREGCLDQRPPSPPRGLAKAA